MASTASKPKDSIKGRRNKQNDNLVNYGIIVIMLLIVFILGGGVYDIIMSPSATVQNSNGVYVSIHPYLGDQTINESIVSMCLFACGIVGLYLVNRGSIILYDKSKSNLYIVLGIGLTLASLAGAYIIIAMKA